MQRRVAQYRFETLNRITKAVERAEFEFPDDITALRKALQLRDGIRIDIWEGARWVGAVGERIDRNLPN